MEWWKTPGGPGGGRRLPRPRRLILHLDIDAFLASVAQLCEPGLIGRPLVVGSGVVASRSYEAKARGVETAMRLSEARALCPGLVLREGDARVAARFRSRVGEILGRFLPVLEVTSLDDMYGDLSGVVRARDPGPELEALTRGLRQQIRRETGLSVSIGLGATRTLARLATDRAKPGGVFWVRPGEEADFLASLPVSALPGVGRRTAEILRRYRIERVAELRPVERALLAESFGKRGEELYWKARGLPAGEADRVVRGAEIDGRPGGVWGEVPAGPSGPRPLAGQISRETSLSEPTADPSFLEAMLCYLADRAGHKLRERAWAARRVEVRLAFGGRGGRSGPAFLEAGRTLEEPAEERETLVSTARSLLAELLGHRGLVQRIGITLARLQFRPDRRQSSLFPEEGRSLERTRRLDHSLDILRRKHGFGSVYIGEAIGLLGRLARSPDGFRLRTPSLSL